MATNLDYTNKELCQALYEVYKRILEMHMEKQHALDSSSTSPRVNETTDE